jgi:hypothetical protein
MFLAVNPDAGALAVVTPGGPAIFPGAANWQAGSTYLVIVRWDARQPIIGNNHVVVDINGDRYEGQAEPWEPSSGQRLTVGAHAQNGSGSASAMIEGLTVYRRPLFDGRFGTDLGMGDEISAINDGFGRDPTAITGAWDVVLAVPSNQVEGPIATGDGSVAPGHAWSFPFEANLLGTPGYMAPGAHSEWTIWQADDAPIEAYDAPPEDRIFGTGIVLDADSRSSSICSSLPPVLCRAGDCPQ